MHDSRSGSGRPLLLIHGIGADGGTWDTVLAPLAAERAVVAVDLPGFGRTPQLAETTIATLTDAVEGFIAGEASAPEDIDVVGSSMGARIALELARRGHPGDVVALDPGGFWNPRERAVFGASVAASKKLVDLLQPAMPLLTGNPVGRTTLLGQFSAKPWALDGDHTLAEMRAFHDSPGFDAALADLVHGAPQEGLPAGRATGRITIGWGRRDLVTLPRQAARALRAFPDAELRWFAGAGHFPHWDAPAETAALVLERTGGRSSDGSPADR